MERLLYSHAQLHTRFGPGHYNTPDESSDTELRARLDDLLARPDDAAVEVVREQLLARPGPKDRYVYMEADIGAPSVADIAAIHLERNGPPIDPVLEQRLRDIAEQRGIPILD